MINIKHRDIGMHVAAHRKTFEVGFEEGFTEAVARVEHLIRGTFSRGGDVVKLREAISALASGINLELWADQENK